MASKIYSMTNRPTRSNADLTNLTINSLGLSVKTEKPKGDCNKLL